jgi:hypothetical protein
MFTRCAPSFDFVVALPRAFFPILLALPHVLHDEAWQFSYTVAHLQRPVHPQREAALRVLTYLACMREFGLRRPYSALGVYRLGLCWRLEHTQVSH